MFDDTKDKETLAGVVETARRTSNRAWLAAEPFTLALSAGFFAFYAYAGMLSALEAVGLRPRRIVGVSAGALAGGLWAGGLSAAELADRLIALRRADFWDPGLPLGGLLRGQKFASMLGDILTPLGIERIEQMQIPFAAIAYDLLRRRPVALDGGPIEPAIRASCAVPLMFRPVWHQRRLLVDGGVKDRVGDVTLAKDERALVCYVPSSKPGHRAYVDEIAAARRRTGCVTFVAVDLPAVGPFHLDRGSLAVQWGEAGLARWLEQPATVPDGHLAIDTGPR